MPKSQAVPPVTREQQERTQQVVWEHATGRPDYVDLMCALFAPPRSTQHHDETEDLMARAKARTHVETMRRAAHEIRDDATIATRSVRPFLHAVADWLDARGSELEKSKTFTACDEPGGVRDALRIAEAYLAEVPR